MHGQNNVQIQNVMTVQSKTFRIPEHSINTYAHVTIISIHKEHSFLCIGGLIGSIFALQSRGQYMPVMLMTNVHSDFIQINPPNH